jgi:hypothetical protein
MPLYQFARDGKDRAFCFIHIPKTGGTAVETYFRSLGLNAFWDPPSYQSIRPYLRIPPAHYEYRIVSSLFRIESMYTFAIVRDPIQRLVSEYKWAIEKSTLPPQVRQLGFSDFIRHMFSAYAQDENVLAGHLKPQYRFVGKGVARIFRYETGLDRIIRQVLDDVGLKPEGDVKLPVINKGAPVSIAVTDDDIALIRQTYEQDFKLFGY